MKLTAFVNEINELNDELKSKTETIDEIKSILDDAGYLSTSKALTEQVKEISELAKGNINFPDSIIDSLEDCIESAYSCIDNAYDKAYDAYNTLSDVQYDAEEAKDNASEARSSIEDATSELNKLKKFRLVDVDKS